MNNFDKIYSVEKIKGGKLISLEVSMQVDGILFMLSQIISLMKKGENVVFFSFNLDSIKITEFLMEMLSKEENVEEIKGNIAIFDKHQIPKNKDIFEFIMETISKTKQECELNFAFFHGVEEFNNYSLNIQRVKHQQNISAFLIFHDNIFKKIDSQITFISDYIIVLKRVKENWLKKFINFFLFWKKRYNFEAQTLKDRFSGKENKFKINIDLKEFVVKIL